MSPLSGRILLCELKQVFGRGKLVFFLAFFLLITGCTPEERQDLNNLGKTLVAEGGDRAKTEAASVGKTLSAIDFKKTAEAKFATLAVDVKTEVPNVIDTLVAKKTAPFMPPTSGYMGLKYKEPYENGDKHAGIDIWASTDPNNDGKLGNPVYAVMGGKLGITGSGVEICHPQLDKNLYPDLPAYLVCTYYGHLSNLPEKFSRLRKDVCPADLVKVDAGDPLGDMENDNMVSNSGIVHLHFSVVFQNPENGCWTSELNLANTLDPFKYLGLNEKKYDFFDPFP
jgi:hypothetical protein